MKVLVPKAYRALFGFVYRFGGEYGVQTDRQDRSAHTWEEQQDRVGTNYIKTKPEG